MVGTWSGPLGRCTFHESRRYIIQPTGEDSGALKAMRWLAGAKRERTGRWWLANRILHMQEDGANEVRKFLTKHIRYDRMVTKYDESKTSLNVEWFKKHS